MRVERNIFVGLGVFLVPFAAIYAWYSDDFAGIFLLAILVLSYVAIGAYLFAASREVGERPEDRADATVGEAPEVVGYFPGRSAWPFLIGVGSMFLGFAAAFTGWLLLPGLILIGWATLGYARDAQLRP